MADRLLEIEDLVVEFRSQDGWVRAVDGVSLSLSAGETLCLVGESGSGKSVTAQSIARLVPSPPGRYAGGTIHVSGREMLSAPESVVRSIRGGVIGYVFQEPGASLNPVYRVGDQILESLRRHCPEVATPAEVHRLLAEVGIPAPDRRARDYPHQLSGGMQQRVMIAMALAARPRLLVADEPTTALDVTIQAQILDLLMEIKVRTGMAILLITHNLGIVGEIADRMAVMYAGQVVETGPARHVLGHPRHPYTRALLRSVPELGRNQTRLQTIPGTVPTPGEWGDGCRFAPRCGEVRPSCFHEIPPWHCGPGEQEAGVRCPYASLEVGR
jgi:oligopeptide/dipeptide ABC transporter ATP-binding protein